MVWVVVREMGWDGGNKCLDVRMYMYARESFMRNVNGNGLGSGQNNREKNHNIRIKKTVRCRGMNISCGGKEMFRRLFSKAELSV